MNINYWYEFSKINNIKPILKYKLILEFNTPKIFFNKSDKCILEKRIINKEQLKYIRKINFDMNIDYILNNKNIIMININDDTYPKLLKNIYDPPISLFVKGNIDLINKMKIAIVGSRKHSFYGNKVCKEISNTLSKEYVIVSGMAVGIDSIAHINSNSKTIAVLGFGINKCYPQSKIQLRNKIAEKSLLISEYTPDTLPSKMNFPARNRIISGLSFATIVIEASKKSGSLITANFALEQGREVFAVPHNIYNNSQGCNLLINDGARIVTSISKLYEEIKNVEIL